MAIATPQKITTFLMFEGKGEEAMTFYTSLFDDAEVISITRYGADEPGEEGTVQHATFSLAGQRFIASTAPSGTTSASPPRSRSTCSARTRLRSTVSTQPSPSKARS